MSDTLELTVEPNLNDVSRSVFLEYCRKFRNVILSANATSRSQIIENLRVQIRSHAERPSFENLRLMVTLHVIVDLLAQGWTLDENRETVSLALTNGLNPQD